MLKHAREFYEYAKPLGFSEPVMQGNDHFRMRHDNGGAVTFACTPSDWRAKANTIADIHRVAEVPQSKPNAAKHTFKKEHTRLRLDRSENEERAIDKAARLSEEWTGTIGRLQQVSDLCDAHGRTSELDALGLVLWQKLDDIEGELKDIGRLAPGLVPWPRPRTYDEVVDLWHGRWPDPEAPEQPAPTEVKQPAKSSPPGLVWEDPPSTLRPREKWAPIVAELKLNPGVWAKVAEDTDAATASRLKKKYPGLESRGESDPARRNRYARLWMRWVGEKE